jgi:Rhamnan synthesis protein F
MRGFSLRFPRSYRLKPIAAKPEQDPLSLLRIGGDKRGVLVPHLSGLDYIVTARGSTSLPIESFDYRVEAEGLLASMWIYFNLKFLTKKRKYQKYKQFYLAPAGPKDLRRQFTRQTRDVMSMVLLDSDLVGEHPELLYGWREDNSSAYPETPDAVSVRAAVVVHIFYEDTWPDIAGALRGLNVPFDLIVTTVPGRDRLVETIQHSYPRAEIEIVENRGRDVGPFMALLERGRLDRYRYICKIHGKKSIDGGRRVQIGAMWRRRLLFDLLSAGAADRAIDAFERDPSIGMIGSKIFRLPNEWYSEELSWSANRTMTLKIAEKMGVPPEKFRLDFFGGTMFWVRPEALKPLKDLRLAADMPQEAGLVDGDLPHALERIFATSVLAAGYRLADTGECWSAS